MSHDNEKAFYKPYVYLVLATLAFFSLTSCSSEDPAEIDPAELSDIENRTAPVGQVNIATAGEGGAEGATAVAETDIGKSTYDSVCFACHGLGIAGAPKHGEKEAWAARLEQGNDTLYEHAIKGYTGANGSLMPAKGGRVDLSDDVIKAAVDYMIEAVGGTVEAPAEAEIETAATTTTATSEEVEPVTAVTATDGIGKEIYDGSCFVCHATGVAGAPKFADKEAWVARISQGNETLYDHAVNGYMDKGLMPPKGGRTDLSDADVKAAVDYMVESSS